MFTPADVNLSRVLSEVEALSRIGAQPSGGMTRYTFSPEHQAATHQVADWMAQAGLHVVFDRWGNLYGRTANDTGSVMSGSHLDSVPNGGNYDGPLGVLAALEAVRLIKERGLPLARPLEVVSFIEEEGARFAGLLGSRLATNSVPQAAIEAMTGRDGMRFLDALHGVDFRYPVDETLDLTQRVARYMELHIEQGRRLETAGVPIGVVTGIAGPNFMHVRLIGRSDHAGATAYTDRHDALLAAAEVIVAVRDHGQAYFSGRGHMTVGHIQARPNVVNVVAGEAILEIDFRAADDETARAMRANIEMMIRGAADVHGLQAEITMSQSVPATPTPAHIMDAVEASAAQAGVGAQRLISWAAHDAMLMAKVCEAGMIFVPCRDGRSHAPEEYTSPEDIAAGIAVLANTLVRLASD